MFYINAQPNESGNYGNPMGNKFPNCVALPDDLLTAYIEARGFVLPTIEDNLVISLKTNQEALDAYLAEHPDNPSVEDSKPTSEEILDILLGVNE